MGLKYTTDDIPGFSRKKSWLAFKYFDQAGRKITNRDTLERIRRLGIPPAYKQVWICPFENGHLQATARDARGRKQYFYHPEWTERQAAQKFERLTIFAKALPLIRRQFKKDVGRSGMPKPKVIGAMVELLDTEYIRIGHEIYAQENHSFGLTTLRKRHLHLNHKHPTLIFTGKSGVRQEVVLHDEKVIKILKACHELPGQELFEYLDDQGQAHPLNSEDINDYLQVTSAADITAKDFRTWHASVIVSAYLGHRLAPSTKTEAQAQIKEAIRRAAEALGNTPTVCKKSYVHPQILSLYQAGELRNRVLKTGRHRKSRGLHVAEMGLLAII